MGHNPTDVEIKYVEKDGIYDLYVGGKFRNFFHTFSEAVLAAEELQSDSYTVIKDPVAAFRSLTKKGGKCR